MELYLNFYTAIIPFCWLNKQFILYLNYLCSKIDFCLFVSEKFANIKNGEIVIIKTWRVCNSHG